MGVDVNLQASTDGSTPLCIAAMKGHMNVIECLVDASADVDIPDDNGFTPLQLATIGGFVQIARFLLSRGANVNYSSNTHSDKEGRHGMTALMFAARSNDLSLVRCLTAAKAGLSPFHS